MLFFQSESGVLFFRAFDWRYVFMRFNRWRWVCVFPRNLLRACFLCLFSRFFHRRHFPALSRACTVYILCVFPRIGSIFSRACFPLQGIALNMFWLMWLLLQFYLQALSFSLLVTRFQRQSKVTRWDVQQGCSFLFSFETSQVQTGTLGLSFWSCNSPYYIIHFLLLICRWHFKRME